MQSAGYRKIVFIDFIYVLFEYQIADIKPRGREAERASERAIECHPQGIEN